MTTDEADELIGEFIRIPTLDVEGVVIDYRRTAADVVDVLIEIRPDDPDPKWYPIDTDTYELM